MENESIWFKGIPLAISVISLIISIWSFRNSSKTAGLSTRAYVYHTAELVNKENLMKAISEKAEMIPVDILFHFKNYGHTPALKVDYTFSYTVPAHTILDVQKDRLAGVDIPPQEERAYSQILKFSSHPPGKHFHGDMFYTGITGKVEYQDVFGNNRTVSVCYAVLASATDARITPCNQDESGKAPTLLTPSRQTYEIKENAVNPPSK
jgi:hypothetical protein